MARKVPPRDPGDDAFAEVREATRALNDALNSLSRSVAGASARTSQAAVADSMHKAASSLNTVAEKLSGATARTSAARGRSETTRQRLLDAAASVFAAKGYEGASVSDIAAAAGFTKGAFYASFSSKEAIFLEVAGCYDEDGDDPGEFSWQHDLADIPIEVVLLQLEMCLYAVRHEESREALVKGWRRSLAAVAARVARSRDRDTASEEDVETAFALIAVGAIGAVVSAATSPEEMNPIVQGAWKRLLEPRQDSPEP